MAVVNHDLYYQICGLTEQNEAVDTKITIGLVTERLLECKTRF